MNAYKLLSVLVLSIALAGCSSNKGEKIVSINGFTMGTSYEIKVLDNELGINKAVLAAKIENILELINSLMSTWREDSQISRINRMPSEQWIKISPDTLSVIELAQSISRQSNGAFDVTLGPLVDLWGFGAKGNSTVTPDDDSIKNAMSRTGQNNLLVNSTRHAVKKLIPLRLNLSAIAKGYAVDKISEQLEDDGYSAYLVEIGGEIRAKGRKPDGTNWKIAIESPITDVRKAHQVISITDQAIATSGDYRNYLEKNGQRFSHIIDPATGKPVIHNLISVTVISRTAARADALATALMVMGPDRGYKFCEENSVSAYFIYKQGDVFQELFTSTFEKYIAKN